MAVYPLSKIVQDVRIALDQNMLSEPLIEIGDVDTLSLNEIISSKIIEAVKRIHSTAPVHLLDGGYNFGDAIYWNGDDTCGWILLPEDFMRFVVFQMDDWSMPMFHALPTDETLYEYQHSRFKGVRGTPQKPKCFISIRPEGRVLEFYSCKNQQAKVSKAVYLPYPKIDELGGVEICSRCYDAVIYTTASLVLATYGNTKSETMSELANSVLI